MASHKAILPEPSKIPSAKPAFCFQWAWEMHSNCIVVLQTDQFVKQMVLCSHWLLQAFTNEFFVVYWWHYRLFVLSIIMPPLPSLSPQLQFSSCFSHILSENTLITNPPLPHFPSTSETIKSSNLHTFKSHEWKRTLVLLLMLLSHSPKNFLFFFLFNSLSSPCLCVWFGETALQCGQSVWVGFDLSSAAAQLTCVVDSWSFRLWILCKIWCHYFLSKQCVVRVVYEIVFCVEVNIFRWRVELFIAFIWDSVNITLIKVTILFKAKKKTHMKHSYDEHDYVFFPFISGDAAR